MTTRQKQAKNTKKKLLESAIRLVSTHGYDNVTIDKIVAESGVSKGTFYIYFKSKHQIFFEIFIEMDRFYDEFLQTLSPNLSSSDKILKITEGQMHYICEIIGRELLRVLYLYNPEYQNYLARTDRQIYKLINTLIVEGQNTSEFTSTFTAEEITKLITRWMRGAIYDWSIAANNNFDLVKESSKQIKMLLEGVKGKS
ncbi:TetR/AcrR family transcriptional regulator [Alkalihalobacterium elongatum]|uniref:TetR/AcrR family transcriptional regulator n=1 Tax=Alkalihalobacterium elongatum TaxID=2675466 RepID=UPI001C1F45CD|nr:TetR/AcrR family transcriptional regulator [Alkalihalobacterium elongatum]